jgi:hypothetical protein
MFQRNGIIVVTEPIDIIQIALSGTETPLPNLPTGDLFRDMKQITIISRDVAWEWRLDGVGTDWFWMDAGYILVFPLRESHYASDFRLRRAAEAVGDADVRIIYEC